MKNIKTKRRRAKAYTEMNTEELRAATREYDAGTAGEGLPGRPLSAEQRKQWQKARRRGRPRVGRGVKVVSVSFEIGVLAQMDADARSKGISRSELLTRSWRASRDSHPRKSA